MHILLVDPTDQTKLLLQKNLLEGDAGEHPITLLRPRARRNDLEQAAAAADVVLFGVGVTEKSVTRMAGALRTVNASAAVLVLTRESESGISRQFKKAGVDAMLNVAELNTPLVAWTLMSSLKQAEVQKKATDFDALRDSLKGITKTLAFITHEINNPLSVIRLALYHLENPDTAPERRRMLLGMISENLDKLYLQTNELRGVRRLLGDNTLPAAPLAGAGMAAEEKKKTGGMKIAVRSRVA